MEISNSGWVLLYACLMFLSPGWVNPNQTSSNTGCPIVLYFKPTFMSLCIFTEISFDKYRFDKHLHGNKNNNNEEVDFGTIEDVVRQSIPALIHFSARKQLFIFLNHADDRGSDRRNVRVVLQQERKDGVINVVIEAHALESINTYRILVITARRVDHFLMQEKQYCIRLHKDGGSSLNKLENNKLIEIASI